jgi:hypothetical protein
MAVAGSIAPVATLRAPSVPGPAATGKRAAKGPSPRYRCYGMGNLERGGRAMLA